MTGWSKSGEMVCQREKVYATIRESSHTVFEICRLCWKSGDETINTIKPPAVRRCLQELRDHTPQMAVKDPYTQRWIGLVIAI